MTAPTVGEAVTVRHGLLCFDGGLWRCAVTLGADCGLCGDRVLVNRVLGPVSAVQVVRDLNSQEVLFVCAYLFEISLPNFG